MDTRRDSCANWRKRTYDDFNRLIGSNQNSGQAVYSYAYDRFGNRWQQNGPHSMQLSFSNANNRMDGYSYDAAGNLLNDGSHGYFYDAENRLIQVDGTLGNCSTATACYAYDAEGRRVRKATASGTLDFLYDKDGHKVAEVDTTGTFQRGELYASGRHFAVFAPAPSGATFFIHADWLGTERARTNMTGTACETITSLPFGDGQAISDTCGDSAGDVSPMHFTGKERDSESNLDYFSARYDSSQLGRFTSPDLLGGHQEDPQTLNKYVYVRNNPVNLTDPTGLDFYLACTEKDHANCVQVTVAGEQKWVQATKDDNGNLNATVITSDSIRAGQNTANVTGYGIMINGDNQGIYFDNPASHSTDAQGKGALPAMDKIAGRVGPASGGGCRTGNCYCLRHYARCAGTPGALAEADACQIMHHR